MTEPIDPTAVHLRALELVRLAERVARALGRSWHPADVLDYAALAGLTLTPAGQHRDGCQPCVDGAARFAQERQDDGYRTTEAGVRRALLRAQTRLDEPVSDAERLARDSAYQTAALDVWGNDDGIAG